MKDKETHEDPDLQCGICGAKGAYDFYGDAVCQKCLGESKSMVRRKLAQKNLDKQK